jgi:hypothetical protein
MSDNFDRPNHWRKWSILFLLTLMVIMPLVFAGWTWVTLHFTYSQGERAGYVQKISKKGWICKTWEGELAMANLPGTMPQIFQFSIRDDAVAQQLTSLAGQRVTLHYEQHRGIPTSCFGETEYFITQVTPVTDTSMTPTLPVTATPEQASK